MLQRAASNAYSWWAASHIRTKQSKWLEQSLEDMQEKVEHVVKLIEEDGDSFARRAEMYYKKRPELINFVEESYRAYRALAERYDHLSKELQTANNTLATVFPEQVQLSIDEEDEYGAPKMPTNFPQIPPTGANIPKAPKKDLKVLITTATKQWQDNKLSKTEDANKDVPKSGLTKSEALEEIHKLQKEILALQTVKEFVKSSYQSGLAKYWGIENQIMEMQQKVCRLEDEFGEGRVIEDGEARTLMAEAALKSCQETLAQLQEKQELSTEGAREEFKKVEDACKKLKSIRQKYLGDLIDEEKPDEKDESPKAAGSSNSPNQEVDNERESLQDKDEDQLDVSSMASLTVTQLAEKIDDLVNKVFSLETAISSQDVLIERLRSAADDLQAQVRILDDDKAALTVDTHNLNVRVRELEEKLQSIQNLNQDIENENSSLRTHLAEARTSLDHLSDKLSTIKPDEELDGADSSQDEVKSLVEIKSVEEAEKRIDHPSVGEGPKVSTSKIEDTEVRKEQDPSTSDKEYTEVTKTTSKHVTFLEPTPVEKGGEEVSAQTGDSVDETQPQKDAEKDDELNWQQMLLNGLEDKEKILLTEYTTVLRNYKEVKKKLSDKEKTDRETEVKVRELTSAIAKRDEELSSLRLKLSLLPPQGNASENEELKIEKLQASDPSCGQSLKPEDLAEREEKDNSIIENDEDDGKMIMIDHRASHPPEVEIKMIVTDQHAACSHVEGKLRIAIDTILDENMDFWLRFSSAFHQIQKFKTTVKDLQCEVSKLRDKEMMQDSNIKMDMKSEIRPTYKHMKEIQNELTVWLEQSLLLKDELACRFSSLCSIQEEITERLTEGVEEIRFSSNQAAKLQGEVLNMKQENNKIREKLETGINHVTALQVDVEKTVRQLDQEFGFAGNQSTWQSMSRSRIPLRAFIFGTKPKKKRSVFSCIHHNKKFHL